MVKMAAIPAERAKFVQSVVAFVKQYNFDGSVGKIHDTFFSPIFHPSALFNFQFRF